MPDTEAYSGNLHIKGNLSGLKLNDTLNLNIRRTSEKTFIQTDRYKYRPGEKVQFRILTIIGNKMEVSTTDVSGGTSLLTLESFPSQLHNAYHLPNPSQSYLRSVTVLPFSVIFP